ncbi:hypothetical protein M2371_001965 [Buttiauxella sp. BIGb0471]|uniref:phage tail fiber protein n=1 Tax=Buttiauxella sp. BIGb0471 TaxID=2940597 RepID=UPI002169A781|nr:phage tail protein [Buttiauxella sp. BIGb0471]MCS3602756.1 hypothetical protein [Buttiauxella sp. BIGb0471]
MIYTTGTIAGNGSTITGTGTNFTAAGSLIRVGCTLIAFTNPVQVLQITAITSGTALSVTPAISPAIAAGTKFAILLSDSLSVDGLAQDIAETFGMYQKYMGGFADVMNGSSDVTITINGSPVTVPGQKSLAKKGANSDITSLSGLTTALSVSQGGTGGKNAADARLGLGLGSAATKDTGTSGNTIPLLDGMNTFSKSQTIISDDPLKLRPGSSSGSSWIAYANSTGILRVRIGMDAGQVLSGHYYNADGSYNTKIFSVSMGQVLWGTSNTTKASDGALKAASPVVKIFADGNAETNEESEGVTVNRQAPGVYLVKGCMGLNADAAWGGIDGGFDIPTDRNKQPLIWLDYEVNGDGSVLVKTYHRTYPDAPEFAQNKVGHKNDDGSFTETVVNGDLIDIPADQFVSVRVEMPQRSIFNQKQAAAQKAMEEAERAATEQQVDSNPENLHNA